jgi:glycosyltransferase involved in cell wall biosynthesis
VDAFALIAEQYSDATLEIVIPEILVAKELLVSLSNDCKVQEVAPFFDSPYLEQIRKRIDPRSKNRVHFRGEMSHFAIGEIFSKASILINPSLSEAFGMSLVEAMACGIPVIAARVGGITEIIDDYQTDLFFDAGDPLSLADAILSLIDNPKLSDHLARMGKEQALRKFTWESTAACLLNGYRSLL